MTASPALQAAALWGGLMMLLMVALSLLTVRQRQRHMVSFGDGGHQELAATSRAFGNTAEYAPAGMIAMTLMALTGAPALLVHALGATLLLGRVIHAIGLLFQRGPSLGRVLGMVLTYLALLAGAASLIVLALV